MMKIARHRSPQQVLSNTMRSVITVPSWTATNTPRGTAHCDALTKINCHHPPQQVLLDLECHPIARQEILFAPKQNPTMPSQIVAKYIQMVDITRSSKHVLHCLQACGPWSAIAHDDHDANKSLQVCTMFPTYEGQRQL